MRKLTPFIAAVLVVSCALFLFSLTAMLAPAWVAPSSIAAQGSTLEARVKTLENAQAVMLKRISVLETAVSARPAVPTVIPAPTTAPSAADPNHGIVFGEPVVFGHGGFSTIGLLVTNKTDKVKSFTVKATYKTGNQIAATASGAVNDLLAGQMRAVTLLSQDKIPANFDTVRVDVDTLIAEASSTLTADASKKITFGAIKISDAGGLATVNVEATNNDSAPHSFSVQAVFVQGEKLVGVATGAINELAPGQTKTATLLVQGTTTQSAQIAIETLLQ